VKDVRPKIIIIDDTGMYNVMHKFLLTKNNYQKTHDIITCETAREAKEYIDQLEKKIKGKKIEVSDIVHLVITDDDTKQEKYTGVKLIEDMKLKGIPSILITSHIIHKDEIIAIGGDSAFYINKSYGDNQYKEKFLGTVHLAMNSRKPALQGIFSEEKISGIDYVGEQEAVNIEDSKSKAESIKKKYSNQNSSITPQRNL
jgi:hypothetical protein